jgi:integrase
MATTPKPNASITPAPPGSPALQKPLPDHLLDGTRDFIVASRSENTRRAYAKAWAAFETWCGQHNRQPLPASLETIAAWMTDLVNHGTPANPGQPVSPATLNAYLAAVVVVHRLKGHAIDRKSPLIADVWKGIARTKRRAPRQARPLLAAELNDMLGRFDPAIAADVRDAALISLGWAAALRRSELVGLDWREHGAGDGFVALDPQGLHLTLIRSKASQDKPETVVVPSADMPEAIARVKAWAALVRLEPGTPLFRPIDQRGIIGKSRLTDRSVARIIKGRVHEIALRRGLSSAEADALAARFSGHSLRAGYATAAAGADMPQYRIQQHTRHKTAEMVARYVREADKWTRSGLKGVWRPFRAA